MSFRFFRRIRVAPGITMNLSKSGGSLSFGPRGAKFTVGSRGKRGTLGLPGTGLFYTTHFPDSSGRSRSRARSRAPAVPPEDRLKLGFFRRLVTPDDEKSLVDGCRELARGNEELAYGHLQKSVHLADGAFLAGFLALKKWQLDRASRFLETALAKKNRLGRYFDKYGISAVMTVPVTGEVTAHVEPGVRGTLLGLVEVYQGRKQWALALNALRRLRRLGPDDPVALLSLTELLLEARPGDRKTLREIVRMTGDLVNESAVHGALLLYRARALRGLDLKEGAKTTLTAALRRKKDRPGNLLSALHHERAELYEEMGQPRRARLEWERLYAQDPDYEDAAQKLGL
ncbi:MAG: DUF4236 domain-containing protein [Nitrospinaceae bacterium]